ncbi:Kinase suppressor of Ras 2 [Nymphon striatum]|nr:Kinase suppressor of Ras 2 [Nymphon striatum]
MIYINIFHCKTCNINLHESCSNNHTCIFYKAAPRKSSGSAKISKSGHSAIYSKFVHWLSTHTARRNSRKEHNSSDEKHVKGKFGLNNSDLKTGKKSRKQASCFSSEESFNCAQVQRVQRISTCKCNETGINCICCECGSLRGYHPTSPSEVNTNSCSSDVMTDFLSSSGYISGASSLNRTPSSEQQEASKLQNHQIKSFNQRFSPTVLSPEPYKHYRDTTSFPFQYDYVRISSEAKARTLSLDKRESRNELLSATWPPHGMEMFNFHKIAEQEHFNECDNINSEEILNESFLEEWSISLDKVSNLQKLKNGRFGSIYRGSWYGDVLIHSFNIKEKDPLKDTEFAEILATVSKIRHENFMMFMGVVVGENQAIITSCSRKALSLYDHVHSKKGKLDLLLKVSLARQLCQGMGYLHAKGIVHKRLNSKNIFIEASSLKISMLDNVETEEDNKLWKTNYGCLPKGHITYISCENMRSFTVNPPFINLDVQHNNATDIFAFGTVLYELMAESWPFSGQDSHSIIWQVGSGRMQNVSTICCDKQIKDVISKCWSFEPEKRPQFREIFKLLPETVVVLNKKQSYSQPEGLDLIELSSNNGKWRGKLNPL